MTKTPSADTTRTKPRSVDVAILGAGTAGQSARTEATALGARVLVVEANDESTTCARVGCMPSKLLVAAAAEAHAARVASRFGVETPLGVRVDDAAVLRRVRNLRDQFVAGVLRGSREWAAAELVRGRARFVTPTRLELEDGSRIEARATVVATGAEPRVPDEVRALAGLILVSDDVFDLEALPRSLVVLGGGLVGVEIGQALARLGVRVTILEREHRLGVLENRSMVEDALRVLTSEEGLQIVLGADVQLESEGDAVRARWRTGGQEHEIRAERVLVAVGRPPAVDRLGLAEIGVEMRDGGPVCRPATRQCGDLPIFVAGDAAGEEPLLHLAVRDGALAGRNAATFPTVSPEPRPVRLRIAFTDPQMAIVGRSQEDFPEGEIIVGESSFEDQGRAVILGRNAGRIRVFAHCGRGTLEGAELFGPDFEHLAHLLAWAVQSGASVKDLLQMPFYHPTLEEGLRTALRDAARNAGWLPAKKSSDRNREHLSVAG